MKLMQETKLSTVKPALSGNSKGRPTIVIKTNYRLMQVKREHSAILWTFIKLPFVVKTFVSSIFEWALKTGFTVLVFNTWLVTL